MTRRNLLLGVGALVVLGLLGAGAAGYTYFFSGARTAPQPLALATPTPGATPSATPAPAAGLAGSWSVAAGSQAEWRGSQGLAGGPPPPPAVGLPPGRAG